MHRDEILEIRKQLDFRIPKTLEGFRIVQKEGGKQTKDQTQKLSTKCLR